MWHLDDKGNEYADDKQAMAVLRERARTLLRVQTSGKGTSNVRMIRLRGESGSVLWEGTVEEAAELLLDD